MVTAISLLLRQFQSMEVQANKTKTGSTQPEQTPITVKAPPQSTEMRGNFVK